MGALAPSGSSLALMYHALSADGRQIAGQDAHYTLTTNAFRSHLDACELHGNPLKNARDWLAGTRNPAALISFDDGHISNYDVAFPLLKERAATADFFINSDSVGREGFCSWQQLREMANAGMSIQSHSHRHQYLTAHNAATLRDDLTRSRMMIEDRVGQPVTLLAPPGGRMPANLAAVAKACGYQYILSSRPGRVASDTETILPRMAITARLDIATLQAWLRGDSMVLANARLRYGLLAALKRVLGDDGYERMRQRVVGRISEV